MAESKLIYQFRSQFSEFDSVPDADVASSLDISALWLDKTLWSAQDYPLAILFWAAHYLSLRQMQLASVEFGGTGATDLFIRQISFGERRVSFNQRKYETAGEKMLGPGEQMLLSTLYGMQFIQLRSRNIIPVVIV
jgi:uncharacterized protein DUF4054